jgi:hypothetical protein
MNKDGAEPTQRTPIEFQPPMCYDALKLAASALRRDAFHFDGPEQSR